MKKIVIVLTIALFALPSLVLAATNGAATGTDFVSPPAGPMSGTKGGGTPQQLGQLSSNVTLDCKFSTTAYGATTKHLNGTKEFGTSSADTKIYSKDLGAGTAAPDAPGTSDAAAFSSWTQM